MTQSPAGTSRSWLHQRIFELPLSDELRVALLPRETYARLRDEPVVSPVRGLLLRASLPLLWIALLVSMMVTAGVTIGAVVNAGLCWSFVVLLQMLCGALLIASAPHRTVSRTRALDLWFAAHLPYSLWLIVPATWNALTGDFAPGGVLLSMLVPLILTLRIATAYCETVLATTSRGTWIRLAVHQACVWSLVVGYILFAGSAAGVSQYILRQLGLDT
jgi:hypothetical protein